MSEKAANVQKKPLRDLQRAWGITAQEHFKRIEESAAHWKQTFRNIHL